MDGERVERRLLDCADARIGALARIAQVPLIGVAALAEVLVDAGASKAGMTRDRLR